MNWFVTRIAGETRREWRNRRDEAQAHIEERIEDWGEVAELVPALNGFYYTANGREVAYVSLAD
jgi:hypothetical protein